VRERGFGFADILPAFLDPRIISARKANARERDWYGAD